LREGCDFGACPAFENDAHAALGGLDRGVYREALMRQAHAALDRVVELMPKLSDEMIFSAKLRLRRVPCLRE